MHDCLHEDDFQIFRNESREAYKDIGIIKESLPAIVKKQEDTETRLQRLEKYVLIAGVVLVLYSIGAITNLPKAIAVLVKGG